MASALYWAREQFFPEWSLEDFQRELRTLSRRGPRPGCTVRFAPYLAGERTSIEQREGAFTGLTLATTRMDLLSAIIEGLTAASAERLPLLRATGTALRRTVAVSGGADRLDRLMHRDWPGRWQYRPVTDATMRGLGLLTPRAR
jgi:xylulokinase